MFAGRYAVESERPVNRALLAQDLRILAIDELNFDACQALALFVFNDSGNDSGLRDERVRRADTANHGRDDTSRSAPSTECAHADR
jgi:hypothetical protein